MTILQLKTSIFSDAGQSSILADEFVARRRDGDPLTTVIVRDLARDSVPHLNAERFLAFTAKLEARSSAQQALVDFSDALIEEIRRADLIVLGLPMYNFGIPSTLKAYFDQIARAGQTFRYTKKGPVGLLTGKKAVVFATRGGFYAGTPMDTPIEYIRTLLCFLGITDVEFVYAEGLAVSDASKQVGLAQARIASERIEARELEPVLA